MKAKENIKKYLIDAGAFRGTVTVNGTILIDCGAIPAFKKFKGKRIESLKTWLRQKTGEVYSERVYDVS